MRLKRLCGLAVLAACLANGLARAADPPESPILQELKHFKQLAGVLMVAAHPDDENTQLLTFLARGRGYRAAYLSVTRGDGGQNFLGPEFGDELGLIRTNELLAARSLDMGQQFFTRAIDFGYSKSPDETLKFWDRDAVLGDVVRVIRTFRPDVIVTVFSPQTQPGQHGHHTASAILAGDAFKIAGDAKAYPEQIKEGLAPWQPKRILLNNRAGGGANTVRMDVGGADPVLNESYASIAARSRAMHKTQGFGANPTNAPRPGAAAGPLQTSFSLLGGEAATNDIMDGIITTWARLDLVGQPGPGAKIDQLTADAIAHFDAANPSASVPSLLEIKKLVDALPAGLVDSAVADRRKRLNQIIADCLALTVSSLSRPEAAPGDTLNVILATSAEKIPAGVKIRWLGARYPSPSKDVSPVHYPVADHEDFSPVDLESGKPATRTIAPSIPAYTPVTQPYWLREEPAAGIYKVSDPTLIGRPLSPDPFPIEYVFDINGQQLTLPDVPRQLSNGSSNSAELKTYPRALSVIAPVSLAFASQVRLFEPGKAKTVDIEVTARHADATGTLKLVLPDAWHAEPATLPFTLAKIDDHVKLTFTVTPPVQPGNATLSAAATIGGQTFTTGRKELAYDHIPYQILQPQATLKAAALTLAVKAKSVGYLPGAGDSVAQCIEQMGCTVTQLKPADLTADTLKAYDAVVLGVRAFNTRDDLGPNSPALKALFDYASNGGTVIEQYNRPDGPGGTNGRQTTLAPFNLHLSGLRVTDETAKVTLLAPEHAVLNVPNKIVDADFANWVQERNIYLPDQWGQQFTPILGMADAGETPPNSSLLVAPQGKGYFVYTSLVFFRELPAGNPGAYRLFANLVSLGK